MVLRGPGRVLADSMKESIWHGSAGPPHSYNEPIIWEPPGPPSTRAGPGGGRGGSHRKPPGHARSRATWELGWGARTLRGSSPFYTHALYRGHFSFLSAECNGVAVRRAKHFPFRVVFSL